MDIYQILKIEFHFIFLAQKMPIPKKENIMHKVFIFLLVNYFCFVINLLGQENTLSYPTVIKNEKPDYIVFSSDAMYMASGLHGCIRIWKINSNIFRDYKTKLKNETPLFICFSPNDKYIAAGVYGAVRVWNIKTGEFVDYSTKLKNEKPTFVKFSPDGRLIACGLFGEVRTWEIIN